MVTKVESNEVYHQSKAISSSALKTIHKKSVYHYLNQAPRYSNALQLGTAIHTAVLEPQNFYDEFYVSPKIDKRTKAGKEQAAKQVKLAEGKSVIEADQYDMILKIKENFERNEQAVYYTKGDIELSHYTTYEGVDVRVRPDCINKMLGFISDPKSCQDNSPRAFKSDVYKWGYHLQAAFYSDMVGIDPKNFVFIAIETNYPYSVECYTLSEKMIEEGRNAYANAIADWKFYLETGIATGYRGYERNENGIIVL